MTTPQEARELAEHYADTSLAKSTLRSLASQVEALTAELESWRFTNRIDELQRAHDAYKADAARYKELMRIAYSDSPQKHLIEVTMDQSKLDAAIAKGTA